MATLDEAFPSKYLKASDLNGEELTVKIIKSQLETLKTLDGRENTKVVLYFHKQQKSLPLNRTNFESVQDVTGENDSDDFPGHDVTLYPTTTTMGGKVMDCIRVKSPEQGPLLAKPAKKKPAQAAPQKATRTKSAQRSLAEDLNDGIPDFGRHEDEAA
jgi:hypothetical protein